MEDNTTLSLDFALKDVNLFLTEIEKLSFFSLPEVAENLNLPLKSVEDIFNFVKATSQITQIGDFCSINESYFGPWED